MNNVTENPLFAIARERHTEDLHSKEYPCLRFGELEAYDQSEQTYMLAFCRGVAYATEQNEAKLKAVTEAFNKLAAKCIEEETPTLHRQNSEA